MKGKRDAESHARAEVRGGIWRYLSIAVLLLAFAFRAVGLNEVPPGLSQDEVLNADIAENILNGQHALFFREGFGHEPLYHYFAAPFQYLLGDNVVSIRLPAILIGLVGVALTIAFGRREFGARSGLVAGGVMAVVWWGVIFGRIGLRIILEPTLLLLAAWHWKGKPFLAGLFLALTIYTYTPAILMLALPLATAIFHRQRLRDNLTIFLTATLLSAPLFIHLQRNPDLLERGNQLTGPLDALATGNIQPLLEAALRTIGVFVLTGDPRWTYALPDKPIFDPTTAIIFAIGMLIAIRNWRVPACRLVLLWLLIGLAPGALTPDAPATNRIIAALPPACLLLSLPFSKQLASSTATWFHPSFFYKRGAASNLLALLTIALVAFRTADVYFNDWSNSLEVRTEKYQTVYRDIALFARDREETPVILDGSFAPIDADSVRRNAGRLLDARWAQAGNALVLPPTPATLYVPEFAPLNPLLFAAIERDAAAPFYRHAQKPGFATWMLPETVQLTPLAEGVVFQNSLELVGFELLPIADEINAPIHLVTAWSVHKPLPSDTAIFLHLVPAPNTPPVSQQDTFDAAHPTLRPSDTILQLHTIDQPPAPGIWHLTIGLYNRTTAQRLLIDNTTQDSFTLPQTIETPTISSGNGEN